MGTPIDLILFAPLGVVLGWQFATIYRWPQNSKSLAKYLFFALVMVVGAGSIGRLHGGTPGGAAGIAGLVAGGLAGALFRQSLRNAVLRRI